MKVPDQLVEAGLVAVWGPRGPDRHGDKQDMCKALEAVLPKVRERLLAVDVVDWEDEDTIEMVFDHAFPEEGS